MTRAPLGGPQIFADYAVTRGHLWALVVAFLAAAPALSFALTRTGDHRFSARPASEREPNLRR